MVAGERYARGGGEEEAASVCVFCGEEERVVCVVCDVCAAARCRCACACVLACVRACMRARVCVVCERACVCVRERQRACV